MALIKFRGKPLGGYNILIIAFATFGSITYGYCSAIIGSTLGQPSFLHYFGLDTASNAAALIGAINGLFQGGGLIGTLTFGAVADKFGRCKAMFLASVLAIIGGGLQAGSVHLAMYERHLPSSWASLFTVPHYRKRALIGFTTLLAGQLTGTTVINNYGPSLYAALGHGASASLALSAGWLTEGLVCNAINAVLLDYVGRKWLMVTGLIGCAISLLGVSIMVALYGGTTNKGGNSAGVFFLYLHLTFYATCMDASTYVYGSEIWPTHLRGKGFAISCAGLFVGSLTLLEAAPTAFQTIGWRFYLIMMAFTLICAIIFAVFFPETKGMTLEEISALFDDEVAIEASSDTKALSINSDKDKVKV
ncbi:hypothetical protein NW756_004763 [Fusarium oxysporum]|nr:hypothetical protein NW763_011301 [Fusarium oxysporum]KAJ4065486.1 hypothetical protein NW753_003919 [Fusarium oxysporum]KAJ4095943.1 hypothetical protein NW756_004763 [Fusarium oxysporum]